MKKTKIYLDFGDIVILKKDNILKRMAETENPKLEEVKKLFDKVSFFKFEFLKNKLGMLNIKEICYDENNKPIIINELNRNIILKDIFHFLHLGLASIEKSENLNINTMNTKVNIASGKISISDGDLYSIKTSDIIELMKVSKIAKNKSMLRFLEEALKYGLIKILMFFTYEDGRKKSCQNRRLYNYSYAPNPYADMVVDMYITNEDFSFFSEYSEPSYLNMYENNYQTFFKKSEEMFKSGIQEKELGSYSERFVRSDFNTVLLLNEDENIQEKLVYLGNYHTEEKDFISCSNLFK